MASPCRTRWPCLRTGVEKTVGSAGDLASAVRNAVPDTTILIAPGTYRLSARLEITVPSVVLRGSDGNRSHVVLRGDGMTESSVGVAIVVSARNVTIADLTAGYVGQHAIQVRGERGASGVTIRNVHLIDTGQQLLKGSLGDSSSEFADNGLLACSRLEYTI